MALVDLIPLTAYKKLENQAAAFKPVLNPLKRATRGWAVSPVAVIAHLTYRCNLDCYMCCQHIPEIQSELPAFPQTGLPRQEMTVEQWKRVIDDLDSFQVRPFLHFSGGEPFLYVGILTLMEYARQKDFNVSVITNGWTLEKTAPRLVELGISRVNVSIDGTEAIHDEVRRMTGSYRRAVDGIAAVRRQREKAGLKVPYLTINCTITKENAPHLEDMVKVMQEAGADYLSFEHLIFLDHERSFAEPIDVEGVQTTLDRLRRERNDVAVYPHVPPDQWVPFYRQKVTDLGNGCGWLWTGIRLHPNGDVSPCRALHFGNLADGKTSLRDLWNNPAYRASRRDIAENGNPEECGRCTHRLY